MEFNLEQPIYQQIMEWMKTRMINGELKAGQKIEAVREMAITLQTNPNTIQRALGELEREGILFSRRGLGRFVSEDEAKILALKESQLKKVAVEFLQTMKEYGLSAQEVVKYLKQVNQEEGMNE